MDGKGRSRRNLQTARGAVLNFYEAIMAMKEPFWLSNVCPECGGDIQEENICEHGGVFKCASCSFKSFVAFQGVEDDCVKCSVHFIE